MAYEAELAFATNLAKEAGEMMRKYFRSEQLTTDWKPDNTPVTQADIEINQFVIAGIQKAFPDHGILGEEESFESDRSQLWVVDPIDGTAPFGIGVPVSTFLLALVDRTDGQPLLGVCYDPYLEEMYTATKGGGAHLNGRDLHVAKGQTLDKSYVTIYGPDVRNDTVDYRAADLWSELEKRHAKNFKIASGAYLGVKIATGQFSVFAMGNGKPWDAVAPAIIIQEAGGYVSDLAGQRRRFDETGFGCLMTANQAVHEQVLALIQAKK